MPNVARQIQLGGLDEAYLTADRFPLPIVPNRGAERAIGEALDTAIRHGRMTAVIGERGSGKSLAAHAMMQQFEQTEEERAELSADYQPRLLVRLGTVRTGDGRELLAMVYRSIMGTDLRRTGAKGRLLPYEQLRDEVVEHILAMNVVGLVIDEAECLSHEALEVLRDILATVEVAATDRVVRVGASSTYRPSPFGVVLLGTPELRQQLLGMPEWGQRLVSMFEIPGLAWEEAAAGYEASLPSFLTYANADREEWEVLLQQCWGSAPPSFRGIENHIRTYLRLQIYQHGAAHRGTKKFDPQLFRLAHAQLARSS